MNKKVCSSYIPAGGLDKSSARKINFNMITHVFLAFAVPAKNTDGFFVPNFSEELVNAIEVIKKEIKEQSSQTRILVSVGGWGAGGFCEAAQSDESRKKFADECAMLAEKHQLDGIDIDWEFPGMASEGVNVCPHCTEDFILLLKEIRHSIGKKLLTAAVGSDHWNRVDNNALNGLLDLINVMTYDMNTFAHSGFSFTKSAMEGWRDNGISVEKLVLGVPFYARCENPEFEWRGYNALMSMIEQGEASPHHEENQDYVLIDENRLSIETPFSVKRKADYIKEKGFAGIFNWQELTDFNGTLRTAMYEYVCG